MTKRIVLLLSFILIFATRIQADELPAYINEKLCWYHPYVDGHSQCVILFPQMECEHGFTPYDYIINSSVSATYYSGSRIGLVNGTYSGPRSSVTPIQCLRPWTSNKNQTCKANLVYVAGDNTKDIVYTCLSNLCEDSGVFKLYYESTELSEHAQSGCRYCAAQEIDAINCEVFHSLYQAEHGGEITGGEFVFPEVTYPVEKVITLERKAFLDQTTSNLFKAQGVVIGILISFILAYLTFKYIRKVLK